MPQVSFNDLVVGVTVGDRLISFPTDTVPALAVRPERAELIFAAKQRSQDKPLILMAATVADLWNYVDGSVAEQRIWRETAAKYLPGALTLVLPASDRVPQSLNPTNSGTIGLRVPNHPIAHAILTATGALATTSANRSGQPALQTMAEVQTQFPQVLTLASTELAALQLTSNQLEAASGASLPSDSLTGVPSTGATAIGVPSTIVRWTGAGWELLRQGAVLLEPDE